MDGEKQIDGVERYIVASLNLLVVSGAAPADLIFLVGAGRFIEASEKLEKLALAEINTNKH